MRAGAIRTTDLLPSLSRAVAEHGLILRGSFPPEPDEAGLEGVGTVFMVGNAGPAMWDAFAPHIDGAPDPLNRWTTGVIGSIAMRFGARALYPFGEPHWPFQRWARRAETLYPSPLGLLIHPEYGLWHAYRAALLFGDRMALPPHANAPDPCASCTEKPCLAACPVGAFDGSRYDVPACAGHLGSGRAACVDRGCAARAACPIGAGWRYPDAQIRFHMAAFAASVAATSAGC